MDSDEQYLSGTLDYLPPRWYKESKGNQDLWGLATTFYRFITGNPVDCMGRAAFMYPKNLNGQIDQTQISIWDHFHKCINRATSENKFDRYLDIKSFGEDILKYFTPEDYDPVKGYNSSRLVITKKHLKYLQTKTSIFSLSGRISRATYISAYIIILLLSELVCMLLIGNDKLVHINDDIDILFFGISMLLLWMHITIMSKRLHDANISGIWAFVLFIGNRFVLTIGVFSVSLREMFIYNITVFCIILIEPTILLLLRHHDSFNRHAKKL